MLATIRLHTRTGRPAGTRGLCRRHIVENLAAWVDDVEERGLEEARKIPGYQDEPLHGKRLGQRSICSSRAYRAIYRVRRDDSIEFVSVFVRLSLQELIDEAGLKMKVNVDAA